MRALRLSQHFIGLLNQAHVRQKIRKHLPTLRRGYCRILATDGSVHDFPQRYISDALTIDPGLTLIDNAALLKFDRSLRRTYRMVISEATRAEFRPKRPSR